METIQVHGGNKIPNAYFKEWHEGMCAVYDGKTEADNQYMPGTKEHAAWKSGMTECIRYRSLEE